MKDNNPKYLPFDKFVFRSPLFPFSFVGSYTETEDVDREYLMSLIRDDVVREAIFLASPSLLDELDRLDKGEVKDAKYAEELLFSLSKYLIRMASRCTPFGLFAGFSLGELSDNTDIRLKLLPEYRSHTRFDMNYLVALSLDLIKDPVVRNNVKFYPNSSINRFYDKIRYVEYKYVKTERNHNIVSVDNSPYLETILKTADDGATIQVMSNSIVDEEICYEIAVEFVNELIDSQLLVSEIEPSITGDEHIHRLISKLDGIKGTEHIVEVLKSARESLEEIDRSNPGDSVNKYMPLSEMINKLNTNFKINYLFQTDLYKPLMSGVLDNKIADEVLRAVDFVSKLSFEPPETNLSKFIERFESKYGETEICILDALDPESGIGFLDSKGGTDSPPLLENLPAGGNRRGENIEKLYWSGKIAFLDKKIFEALKTGTKVIELKEEDVKGIESNIGKMAHTFSVVVKITSKNLNGDNQIYISSAGGSSAAYLLGRFCHADKQTDDFVKLIAKKEEEFYKDSIVAEIVHLPQARVGNVLLHPKFHNYEIPYLAVSDADSDHRIDLKDIFLSVMNRKILMRSKKLNKRIIPRLSNAHNYSFNAQPIYQFLCEMQFQDITRGASLPLSNALDRYGHVPRIVYGNVILHAAEWKLMKKDIEPFIKLKSDKELTEKISEWRIKHKLPELVQLVEGDNKMLINLDNIFCVRMLLDSLKGGEFVLSEFLFDEENAVVSSDDGAYLNEFIISYYRAEK
jgi:hypothetical protein